MMPMMYGMTASTPNTLPATYQPEYPIDEWSRQMLVPSNARRVSRGSNGQRSGGAMRISKPTSASNSPRGSMMTSRRSVLMNDPRIRQQLVDQGLVSSSFAEPHVEPAPRAQRPVSWHPGTQLQFHPQSNAVASPVSYPIDSSFSTYPQYSPVPAVYSCQASPVAFSPLSLPFAEYPQSTQGIPMESWTLPSQSAATIGPQVAQTQAELYAQSVPVSGPLVAPIQQQFDWNVIVSQGYTANSTTPPTPDCFPPAPQPEPVLNSEESIPYQPLEDEEEEGEILVSIGLYDTPGKDLPDTGLDNYRTTTSHLLNSTTGKGLKLFEAWAPPPSDEDDSDEEDEDDDDEQGQVQKQSRLE